MTKIPRKVYDSLCHVTQLALDLIQEQQRTEDTISQWEDDIREKMAETFKQGNADGESESYRVFKQGVFEGMEYTLNRLLAMLRG